MRRALFVLLLLAAAAGAFVAHRAYANHQLEQKLAAARRDLNAGRLSTALRMLEPLVEQHPGTGEGWFMLGRCYQAMNRFDDAVRSWRKVPPSSPFHTRANLAAAGELINDGRYSLAEELLSTHRPRDRESSYEHQRLLIRLYRFQGRTRDVRALLRAGLPLADNPGEDLKELWLLDTSPLPVEALAKALQSARADDPRVWLGKANLAIVASRFDEARHWLEQCQRHDARDLSVRRAAYDLAAATLDPASLRAALSALRPADLEPLEPVILHARLLESRETLERLLDLQPESAWACDRLAALAAREGNLDEARALNLRKSTLDVARDQFRQVLLDGPIDQRASELATLAEQIGERFQARAWRLLADVGRARWKAASAHLPIDDPELPQPQPSFDAALLASLDRLIARGQAVATANSIVTPVFVERAAEVGLVFTYDHGASSRRLLPETMSGGVALLDYDSDGWLDVFVVQGGPLDDDPTRPRAPDRLFRNRGDGTFEDVTESSGIAQLPRGYGLGVAVGDIDNDGHPDLFLSRLRSYALWRNTGNGRFEDVTDAWGLAGLRENPTSAAFADLDDDGDLDLYVCHYMRYDPQHPVLCQNERGEFFYCDPSKVEAAPDRLFRNEGNRFVDVTDTAGIVDRDGRGLGVVAADFDQDRLVDLYVANDGTANFLFRNLGNGTFKDVALAAGVAGSGDGGYQASMGIACGDLDGDLLPDLIVTNFYGEASTLYRNLGAGLFADWTTPSGLGAATRFLLGFGTSFLDYDNDADLDLVTTYGHVNDNRPYYPYAMPAQLLANLGDGRLVDASKNQGVWSIPHVGRGLAVGDIDNDGRLDCLILPQGTPLVYLHNQTPAQNWIRLTLLGTHPSRDASGARVLVRAGGKTQAAERIGGGSYQSASDTRLHFGVGTADRVDPIEIQWPDGSVETHGPLEVNRDYRIRKRGGVEPITR